ncbi:MAG: Gfo/Idh/MocA family oxidoreductase [Planctomycetota bacterium]
MSSKICRWGILGAADIARKNWKSIWTGESGVLTAVASRDAKRAQNFIDECQSSTPFLEAPQAVEGYDALIAREDVDAVYIPLPTGVRTEWAVKAANAGKHVMVEKPCGCNLAEVQQIIDACNANNVQFMDGVMLMHTERVKKMREVLDDGVSVGELRRISVQFTFNGGDDFHAGNIRVSEELEPLGCLGDIGWYCIRLTLIGTNWQLPTEVRACTLTGTDPNDPQGSVPIEFEASMKFPGGVSSNFYCSFITEMHQYVSYQGTKGALVVDDHTLPFHGSELAFNVEQPAFDKYGCDFIMEPHTTRHATREYSHGHPTAQESRLFETFSRLVNSGERDPRWADYTLATQRVLDACARSARSGETVTDI